MCWQGKSLYWEGAPGQSRGGCGNSGGPLYHVACSLRLSGGEFPGYFWPVIPTLGLPWQCMHCSAKRDYSKEDPGRWWNTRHLFLTFPEFSQLGVVC